MLDVLCRGNREHYDYLMKWMAFAVQHPDQKGQVAVVMRGNEGSGKGTLASAFGKLFGQHYLQLSNSNSLTGRFNAELGETLFCFADEAFFAADRSHENVLKALVTEPFIHLEAKFKNAGQGRNHLHIMMASNKDWVVPASFEARRFFVLDVPDDRIGDKAYFAAIRKQMESGGTAAMFAELKDLDLSGFDVSERPTTAALLDQQMQSLDSVQAWWLNALATGEIPAGEASDHTKWERGPIAVDRDTLYQSYTGYASGAGDKYPTKKPGFGKRLRSLVPVRDHQPAGSANCKRSREYLLPDLLTARNAFAAKLKVQWADIEATL
jgi:phage/plasmid-associated DNA primase